MIYTLTLNPALDYVVELADFQTGTINRSKKEWKYPGGKGINVSRVLKNLGTASTALGFTGGFTGEHIEKVLQHEHIETDFVKVNGDTRINVKVKAQEETEINGMSPEITEEHLDALKEKLTHLSVNDQLVIAGSLPKGLPVDTYKQFIASLKEKGVKTYVDTSGKALKKAMEAGPYFVKPNHLELAELYEVSITTVEDAACYGKKLLHDYDITHAVISMAGEGAVYLQENQAILAKPPHRPAVNSVGAGDSLVAGFLHSHLKGESPEETLTYAVSAGSATAFSESFGTEEDVKKMYQDVQITVLEPSEKR
ncbi:fructose-1-phosphate kinase [Alteribacillus persepolensis]|uniref:Tagatose-6-phosphate kinase n=1 Tax=Alteribacillus persepolensis TaxID=568899 RepID=A0A1G8E4P7_9BACI|nr:1-phosphofructokinase [Alteribacillus persepolensis]SDH64932.1 fructose-1-phosphate kinase [Alteribacillus persepolensis]